MEINAEIARKVLQTVDAGLVKGMGEPVPGKMCVEAAVCFAMGLPHSDNPSCVAPSLRKLKITLNDSCWSSDKARTLGLRKLALLQLGSKDVLDEREFASRVVILVVKQFLPIALRKAALEEHAVACEAVNSIESAKNAINTARGANDASYYYAYSAAMYVYNASYYYANNAAANAAAEATYYAAYAVSYAVHHVARTVEDPDSILNQFAEEVCSILISMNVPGVEWLSLL